MIDNELKAHQTVLLMDGVSIAGNNLGVDDRGRGKDLLAYRRPEERTNTAGRRKYRGGPTIRREY